MEPTTLKSFLSLLFFALNYTIVTATYFKKGDRRCDATFVKFFLDSVRLDCPGGSINGDQWKHEEDFLFADRHLLYKKFGDNAVLLKNYSLYLENISLWNEGVYECFRNSSSLMKYCLQIIVLPDVQISTNGYHARNTIAVERYKEATFVCTANRSKPAINLTWIKDNQYILPPETFHVSTLPGSQLENTYDTVSHLHYYPVNEKENITCVASHPLLGEISARTQIVTYIFPNLSITFNGKRSTHPLYVERNANMTATCSVFYVPLTTNISWVTNNIQVLQRYTKGDTVVHNGTENQYLLSTTMTFQPLADNGNLTCQVNDFTTFGVKSFNITYITYVLPDVMFMTIDSYAISNGTLHTVMENNGVNIGCHSYGSRPASTVSMFAGKQKIHSLINMRKSNHSKEVETYDSFTNIAFIPSTREKKIACITNYNRPFGTEYLSVRIVTYVPPLLSLIINSNHVTNMTNYTYEDKLIIFCQAIGPVPFLNLSILVDEHFLQNSSDIKTNVTNETKYYITTTKLSFKPPEKRTKITCINYGFTVEKITAFVYLSLLGSRDVRASFNLMVLVLILICLICSVAAIISTKWWLNKRPSSKKTQSMELRDNIDTSIQTSRGLCSPLKIEGSAMQDKDCKTIPNKDLTRKNRQLSSCLPEVPTTRDDVIYSSPSTYEDVEEACYAEFGKSLAVEKRILPSDVCQIYQIKCGDVYNRWMGSLALTSGGKKCVVLSTLSERSLMKTNIQWDVFVKRVLQLPVSTSVATVEGFYVDKGLLYLIHEYLTCETLESYLQRSSNDSNYSSAADVSLLEVHTFISDILKGMELLHSYGFLHPKLSTRKILYKADGRLCLYDFCIPEDAPKIISSFKLKNSCNPNEIPPESILRNEYTSSSDLWSVAAVIWNIMSGSYPFTGDKHTEAIIRGYCGNDVQWPSAYWKIRNPQLLSCWNVNSSLRPTARELRLSFEEIFAFLHESTYDKADQPLHSTEIYMPMKGNVDYVYGDTCHK